jgi:hypothetical protein
MTFVIGAMGVVLVLAIAIRVAEYYQEPTSED